MSASINDNKDGRVIDKVRTQPIIFLDIDGVLNRTKHSTHIRLDDDLVQRFKWLVDQSDAYIVLNTFWRHFQDYIAYILSRHGISPDRILGATPGYNQSMIGRTAKDETEYVSRAQEIRAWLVEHHDYYCQDKFVILDDRPSAADDSLYLQSRFVQCDTNQGITEKDALQALEILQGKLKK